MHVSSTALETDSVPRYNQPQLTESPLFHRKQAAGLNRSALNATPPSPSFHHLQTSTPQPYHAPPPTSPGHHSLSSHTTLPLPPPPPPPQSRSPIPPPKPTSLLTGNAVPKPYIPFGGATVETHTTTLSPASAGRVYETSTLENYKLNTSQNRPPAQSPSFNKASLEACVQDLHEKTFGRAGAAPMSTFKNSSTGSLNGQGGYEQFR